eukprot:CAMPEP_0194778454 /NCGR_PEP_ID=MMETSP0323_2-20130528/68273_1 /TAXON_ID=2866 ORGANISM="Crypthecodinium cohnii, Strain Seligo" /NCGR_SAMPLE_ID=MMETSP0323_2 /ASSEMBLY_ACC=CAM_ASM_000346 /LENGTH=104 /DNA_ID=CAMNT_0039715679 /DNA_START=192 /DNA_END=505 /DNA_ORIENTATION=+
MAEPHSGTAEAAAAGVTQLCKVGKGLDCTPARDALPAEEVTKGGQVVHSVGQKQMLHMGSDPEVGPEGSGRSAFPALPFFPSGLSTNIAETASSACAFATSDEP